MIPYSDGHKARLFALMLVLASVVVWVANAVAMPVPGTSIVNVGTAEFIDSSGDSHTVLSNPAYVIVGEARSVNLEQDQFLRATPGQTVYYRHRLTNTGNIDDAYTLSIDQVSDDQGDFSNVSIFLDINEDGLPSAGEPELTATDTIAPQAFIHVVVAARVPTSAQVGQQYSLRITASSIADAAVRDSNTDGAELTDGAVLLLNKHSNQRCDKPLLAGDQLDYAIQYRSVASQAPKAKDIVVDGSPMSGVLVIDNLPDQLQLLSSTVATIQPTSAVVLVKLQNELDPNAWLSFDTWNGVDPVTHIAGLFPATSMDANDTGGLQFSAVVRDSASPGELFNSVELDSNADNTADTVSNAVCNTISHGLALELNPDRLLRMTETTEATPVVFEHTLQNTGGVEDSYTLSVIANNGDSADMNHVVVYIDNGDGFFDATADTPYSGVALSLAANEAVTLFVQGDVPAGMTSGDTIVQQLIAVSSTDPTIRDSHTETVTFRPQGVAIQLTKTTSRFCELIAENEADTDSADRLLPGEQFTYGLQFFNDGSEAPQPQQITLDGVVAFGVLLKDTLPYGLRLVAGQQFDVLPTAGQVIVQRFDDVETGQWLSYSEWNGLDPIATFAVLYPAASLSSDATGSVSFDVQVVDTATASTEFYNRAVFDVDADGVADSTSNQVCNLVGDNSDPNAVVPDAEIRFLSPTLDLILNRTPPAHADDNQFIDTTLYRIDTDVIGYDPSTDGVFIEVTSTTLREGDDYLVLSDGRRQVVVDVESLNTGDSSQVVLRETVPGSGVYRSIRTLVLSEQTSNSGGVCPPEQGSAIDYSAPVTSQCTLLSVQDDDLKVTITDTGINKVLEDDAIVDPLGVVFDSQTLQPVVGAEVVVCSWLALGETNGIPAELDDGIENDRCGEFGELAIDPFSPSGEPLAVQTTGNDGFYQYPFLFAGDYFIDVNAPLGYAWPSTEASTQYDNKTAVGHDRILEVVDPSYGRNGEFGNDNSGVFALNVIQPILVADLPVDPVLIDLTIDSSCNTTTQRRNEDSEGPINYDISFTNQGDVTPPELTFSVDGVEAQGVLFQSRLPFETTPIFGQTPTVSHSTAQALAQTYAQLGTNEWLTFDAWDGVTPLAQLGALFSSSDVEQGESGRITFDVDVTDRLTAGTELTNLAYLDVDGDGSADAISNAVCGVDGTAASLRFVAPAIALRAAGNGPVFEDDDTFIDIELYRLADATVGSVYDPETDGVYIELFETSIPDTVYEVLSTGQRQVVVTVNSTDAAQSIEVVLVEVAIGRGIYRSVTPLNLSFNNQGGPLCTAEYDPVNYAVAQGDSCVLQAQTNDHLTVEFAEGLATLTDNAIVDPLGVVFNSVTLEPVEGAVVGIYHLDGSLPLNPFTGLPLEPQTTGADGGYHYPFMLPGTYYMDVTPPEGSLFPSEFGPNVFIGSQFSVTDPSYGRSGFGGNGLGEFTLDASNPLLVVDFPVDVNADGQLIIDKSANQHEVAIGGIVEYTVTLKNIGATDLNTVWLNDKLPYGFKYIENTARIDGERAGTPQGGAGPNLQFYIGELAVDQSLELSYYLQATAGAVDSDGINIAQATAQAGPRTVESNVARAKVALTQSGVMSDSAYIFGKVFVDVDCNNLQSKGEWPIGAVKLYMEDGTYAITDENGQYSLYGIRPGLHVLKVDPLTMPEGLTLKPLDNRHGADGDSRFVDLKDGEYHRADFAAACPPPALVDQVKATIEARNGSIQGDWMLDEAARFDPTRDATRQRTADANGELSQGVLGGSNTASSGVLQSTSALTPVMMSPLNETETLIVEEEEPEPMPLTQDIVKLVTAKQAKSGEFLWPKGDTAMYGRFMVVVRTGIDPTLFVNGEAIPFEKVGEQFINKRERAQVLSWYGVSLKPGPNTLEVKGKDPFGNLRVLAKKTFHSPGLAKQLQVEALDTTIPADGGRSAGKVVIRLLDEFGYPARGVHFVTVETSDGIWLEPDIQDKTMGYQARIRNGEKILHLRSSEFTGDVRIVVTNDQFEQETLVSFVPSNRSLVVSGVASAGYNFGQINGGDFGPTDQKDGLGNNGVETRAAIFMKGKIKGGMHLTLSYDTDKDSAVDLLRDINPNEYYPIHGDNSIRGFEAQSRSKLYAKLEKDRHSLLWGDYVTGSQGQSRDLSRVNRTLSGARAIYDDGKLNAQVFAAQEEDGFYQVEIPANGTAMLYRIEGGEVSRHSEVIELITRDRETDSLVLTTETLQRFVDYTVDYVTGDIRFTRSIASLDQDLNPRYVRISYNKETGGNEALIAGVRVEYQVNDKITVGGAHTQDDHDETGTAISGAFASINATDQTTINVSVATMSHENGTASGNSALVEVQQQWGKNGNTTATFGRADEGFTNSGGGVSADNQQLRINHNQSVTKNLKVTGEVMVSEKLTSTDERRNVSLTADYKINEWIVRAGGRRNDTNNGTETDESNSIVLGLGRNFELFGRGGAINLEHEKEVAEQQRQRWTADANWQVHEKAKMYGRYEQVDTILGNTGSSAGDSQRTGSLGFESTWIPSTTVFNEYRMRGVADGRDLESASGIRGDFELVPGLRINPSFEFIETMQGDSDNGSIAASLGLTDTRHKNARKSLRIESRLDESRHYYGLDASYVARVNLNWSSFIRENLRITEVVDGDNELDQVFTFGLAHRPRLTNKYHSLWLYQWIIEESDTEREAYLFSTHQNLQFNEHLRLSGRLGYKLEEYEVLDNPFESDVFMLDSRIIWDLSRRFDLDVHGGTLATNGTDQLRYSVGLGLNYLVNRGLRLHTGYNFVGFDEKDLDGESYNAQGFSIGLQYKFDETLFDWGAEQ